MTTELSTWASAHGLSTVDAYAATMMRTFGPPQLVLARGEGAHVWDDTAAGTSTCWRVSR